MTTGDRSLYDLLPVVHRLRDSAAGDPLRALLQLLDREVERLEDNIAELYDDWFIETCSEWVVPYIGDLLGVRHLLPIDDPSFTQRAYVANTIAYRRRKGTAAVLGQLAGDLSGWPALVLEMFEQTVTTQHVNHVRLHAPATASVRDPVALQDAATPFETLRRTAEVRHIDNGRGRTNIPNVGVFLWPMQAFPLAGVTARAIDAKRFTFDPLGASRPLAALRGEVALPLSRRGLHRHLDEMYGDATDPATLTVSVGGSIVDRADVVVADLSDAPGIPGSWYHGAPPGKVSVDPQLGRIAFADEPGAVVTTSHAVLAPGDLGGGPYDQRDALAPHLMDVDWQIGVTAAAPPGDPQLVGTLGEAVAAWNARPAGDHGVIVLMDSATLSEDLDAEATRIAIPAGSRLVIASGQWPLEETDVAGADPVRHTGRLAAGHRRTHLRGALEVVGTAPDDSPDPGSLVVAGALFEGALTVRAGNLGALHVVHATLAPGACAFTVEINPDLAITLHRTIAGPVDTSAATSTELVGCIVDGALDGRHVVVDSSTLLGPLTARTLEATSSLLVGPATVERRQVGCVRYSYLPEASLAPRRFRCQPDHHTLPEGVVPSFVSETFGAPGFAVLRPGCSTAITEGAEHDTEMGAWRFLHAPQRLRNLRGALDQYLRFGLEVGASLTDEGVA